MIEDLACCIIEVPHDWWAQSRSNLQPVYADKHATFLRQPPRQYQLISFRMMQLRGHDCVSLEQLSKHRIWTMTNTLPIDYPWWNAKHLWRSLDTHFHDGQGACHYLCSQLWRPILSLCIVTTKLHLNYLTLKTINPWHSVDAYSQNGAGSVWLLVLPSRPAHTA